MAKYDEFGRPIYETAEEYNRAHKTGNTSRTYDSPEGNAYKHNPKKNIHINKNYRVQNTSRTGAKRSNSVIVILAISMIACVFGVLIAFNTVRSSVGEIYEVVPEDEAEAIVDVDDTTPLPDGFENFSYNGKNYCLPTTMAEINTMGFYSAGEYEAGDMIPTDFEDTLVLNDEDGLMAAMVRIINYTGEEIPLEECQVVYFYITNRASYDEETEIPDFVFGDGLTFESSYEEVEAYLGVPTSHYEDHTDSNYYYDSYQWEYYGEEEIQFVYITFWNGMISDIEMEKRLTLEY